MSAITMADVLSVVDSEPFRFYLHLTSSLLSDPRSVGFSVPSASAFSNAPAGYYEIITTPMDLGTVWRNLTGRVKYVRKRDGRAYFDESAVLADLRTVLANFRANNVPGSAFYAAACVLLAIVEDQVGKRERTLKMEKASGRAFAKAEASAPATPTGIAPVAARQGAAKSESASARASAHPQMTSSAGGLPHYFASVAASEPYQFFLRLVGQLLLHPRSYGFHIPMTELWTAGAIPGYLDKIKNPMDLGTVRVNLLRTANYIRKEGDVVFFDEAAVVNDIRTVFTNSIAYNRPGSVLRVISTGFLQVVDATVAKRRHTFEPFRGDARSRKIGAEVGGAGRDGDGLTTREAPVVKEEKSKRSKLR